MFYYSIIKHTIHSYIWYQSYKKKNLLTLLQTIISLNNRNKKKQKRLNGASLNRWPPPQQLLAFIAGKSAACTVLTSSNSSLFVLLQRSSRLQLSHAENYITIHQNQLWRTPLTTTRRIIIKYSCANKKYYLKWSQLIPIILKGKGKNCHILETGSELGDIIWCVG